MIRIIPVLPRLGILLLAGWSFLFGKSAEYNSISETTLKKAKTMLIDSFPNNPVIAHRGAWKADSLPQNSIASLKAALSLGASGSETDLHMTVDGHLVMHHDADVENHFIQKSRYEDLRNIHLSNGESLPVLSDFLKVIQSQTKTKLILEIKPSIKGADWAMETVRKTVDEIMKQNALPWIVFISFDYNMCKEIVRLLPDASVQYLNGDKSPVQLKDDGIKGMDYHHSIYKKFPEWIQEAKASGIVLNAWTVNNEADMNWFLDHNFDQITTDHPELLMQLFKNRTN